MPKRDNPLTVIDGSQDEQKLFQKLLDSPHSFSATEFEQLLERFGDRLDRSDRYELTVRRVRERDYDSALEKKALLAILEGRQADAERLRKLLERRNRTGIKVVSGGPASRPRSI